MRGWLTLALGLLAVVVGAVWTVQGLGYVGGSVMSDSDVLGRRRTDRRWCWPGWCCSARPAGPAAALIRRTRTGHAEKPRIP